MTTNRYAILLFGAFVYLCIFLLILTITASIGFDIKPYRWPIILVLVTFPMMAISITSYLLGRAIFTPKKTKISKSVLTTILLMAYFVIAVLSYNMTVSKGHVTDWQYLIQSLISLIMFVGFPMWLARPNKLLLKLTAWAHKGF